MDKQGKNSVNMGTTRPTENKPQDKDKAKKDASYASIQNDTKYKVAEILNK